MCVFFFFGFLNGLNSVFLCWLVFGVGFVFSLLLFGFVGSLVSYLGP